MAEAFFDTNVLLYLVSADETKAGIAESTLGSGGHISVQVLNEFVSVGRRKAGLGWDELADLLDQVRQVCAVHPLLVETHDRARALAKRHELPFYDALIVSSALEADCEVLYSEDLQHGRRFGGVTTIRNPFRG